MTTRKLSSKKTFLERPEGKVGLAATTLGVAAAGYGVFLALPTLITFVSNLLELAALSALLGLMAYLCFDAKFRAFASYSYRVFWRWIVGVIIELDPIGILNSQIRELAKKLGLMRDQLASLRGQIRHIERVVQENLSLRETAMELARAARNAPEHAAAGRLQARQAVKLEESNANLQAMQLQMESLFRMLKRLHDASEMVLSDMQSTVEIKTRERASMNAAYSAYRAAFAILQGNSEGREIYDRALEFLNEDYARKLGEIELFMDFSDGLIKAADLENLAYDAAANQKLDEWERRLTSTLLGNATTSDVRLSNDVQADRDPLDSLLDPNVARPRSLGPKH